MAYARSKLRALPPLLSAYRRALSSAVVAHAQFLAAQGDKSATAHLVDRRRDAWLAVESRKARLLDHINQGRNS